MSLPLLFKTILVLNESRLLGMKRDKHPEIVLEPAPIPGEYDLRLVKYFC